MTELLGDEACPLDVKHSNQQFRKACFSSRPGTRGMRIRGTSDRPEDKIEPKASP
jgi:hypothetical protein